MNFNLFVTKKNPLNKLSGKIAMKKKKCDLLKNHMQIYIYYFIKNKKKIFFFVKVYFLTKFKKLWNFYVIIIPHLI